VVRLSSLTFDAAAALVVVDRAISYLSIIVLGAVLFLARQVIKPLGAAPTEPGTMGDPQSACEQ
jgi:uncharacterized membrane protein YbhN (UPF0104 family)